ncbi:MAG: TadE family protein [Planctomycetales bacterium]
MRHPLDVDSTPQGGVVSRRGATLYEAAIAIPILLILVVGAIEYGRAFMIGQLVTSAAREGARKVSEGAVTTTGITQGSRTGCMNSGGSNVTT